MNSQAMADQVQAALEADPRSDKELARAIGSVPRTIQSWRERLSIPSAANFFELCRHLPELRAAALEWLEAEDAFDAEAERAAIEVLRQIQQRQQRRRARVLSEGPPK